MKKLLLLLTLVPMLQVNAQNVNGPYKGTLKAGFQKLTVTLDVDANNKKAMIGVVEQGATGVEVQVDYLSEDSILFSKADMLLKYGGKLVDGKIKGVFSQSGMSFPLDFEPGALTFNRPQEPKPPYPYRTEEVTFSNAEANVTLAGTLTYPVNFKRKKTPIVLMVSGSGQQNRDEELFYHKPFLVIADWLARHGIASLRYDDRGYGQSTGKFEECTTQDFANDAEAGILYLKGRKEFSKVGLLGHSEGGAIAYMLGSKGVLDFIVNMAGPACKIDTMMVMQLNLMGHAQGANTDIVKTAEEATKYLKSQAGGKWMDYFVVMDLRPYASKTTCPVMAIGGEFDFNVPPAINSPAIEQYLPKNPQNLIKVYPGLNHLFQHATTGDMLKCVNIEETISPEVLDDMSTWINGLKKGKR